jgi:hypothetical protein
VRKYYFLTSDSIPNFANYFVWFGFFAGSPLLF